VIEAPVELQNLYSSVRFRSPPPINAHLISNLQPTDKTRVAGYLCAVAISVPTLRVVGLNFYGESSPLGLQEGAEKVAKAENIRNVILDPASTTTNYILKFLNEVHVGIGEKGFGRESICVTKIDKDGNVYETVSYDDA